MPSAARSVDQLFILAAAVILVGCTGAALIDFVLPAAAAAHPSEGLLLSARIHAQSDAFFPNWFGPVTWNRQKRRLHRSSASSIRQRKTESTGHNRAIPEAPKAPGANTAVEQVPLPPPRPADWPEPHSFAEAAGPNFNSTDITSAPSDCDQRLASIAVIELLPRLIGPGDCGGRDMVELDTVLLPNHRRIEVTPAAILRCQMAESFAAWIRDEASPETDKFDTTLHAVETFGSYECRGRNGVPSAKLSEHGKGNAVDLRALRFAHGHSAELTDVTVEKSLREDLRDSACHRFTTVLGPGSDRYHDSHVHLDDLARAHGHRICEWDVREPLPAMQIAGKGSVHLMTTPSTSVSQRRNDQTIAVGPWAVATNYRANKFTTCTMSRSVGELGVTFARTQDGLVLILDSPKWKLDRGKSYPVRLSAGSRFVRTMAVAEPKSVTIALEDAALNSRLRSVRDLEVRGEGDTLHVPLDGSSVAFERLEECFNKAEGPQTNPFASRKTSETNPFVSPNRKR